MHCRRVTCTLSSFTCAHQIVLLKCMCVVDLQCTKAQSNSYSTVCYMAKKKLFNFSLNNWYSKSRMIQQWIVCPQGQALLNHQHIYVTNTQTWNCFGLHLTGHVLQTTVNSSLLYLILSFWFRSGLQGNGDPLTCSVGEYSGVSISDHLDKVSMLTTPEADSKVSILCNIQTWMYTSCSEHVEMEAFKK